MDDPLKVALDAFRPFREQRAAQGYERRCDYCGEPFISRQPTRRFCDDDCRREHHEGGGKKAAAPKALARPPKQGLGDQLEEAQRRIADQANTILRLQQAITAAERRAELAEEAVRRAYKGFAAAGGRR